METIKHPCVPQTMTPEALADWIQTQKVDVTNHVEQIPLTEEEIIKFEHDSSLASRAIDRLMEVKKHFDYLLKKGTPYDKAIEQHKPSTVTIPPSKGLDALKANREYADQQITNGYKEEITALYLIPYPEQSRMIMVNITGIEWPEYSRDMTADEINQYKPLLKVNRPETVQDTAVIKESKKKTRSQRIEEQKAEDEALFPDGEKISVKDDDLESDIKASPADDLPFE